ncbi:MAG: DUF4149 domain-containing protein [Alteromonas sp.]|jgi:hypothetical protein|uniref:DUF4149 domain-containing protein n=1 Tax=Alteromonas sp. TaxID=232 RepID=UPI0032D95E45
MFLLLCGCLVVIVGGMVTFQALFAPLIFIKLPSEVARPFIRTFFPFYYLYFGALSLLATASAIMSNHWQVAWLIAPVTLGFIVSRQILMPLANHATDNQQEKKFQIYHRLTVLINTVQLVALCVAFYWLLAPY